MDQLGVRRVHAGRGLLCQRHPGRPWRQEPQPITPPNYGHGRLFRTLEGKWLMALHSHANQGWHYHRVPCSFEVDLADDKLKLGKLYQP